MQKTEVLWTYSLFIALAFLLLRGYDFNTGDQAEHLPQVYQLLDNELYKGDFFLERYNETFTVRYFYVLTIYFFSLIVPVSIVCFCFTIICLTIAIWGWIKIAEYFSKDNWCLIFTPILVYLVFYGFTLGGNYIQYNTLGCSTFAKAFLPIAIWQFLIKRYYISALLIGIATLFQAMAGGQIFAILFLILLFDYQKVSLKNILLFGLIYISIASWVLIPLFSKQFLHPYQYDKQLFSEIMYEFRNPGHFSPLNFPLMDYIRFLSLYSIGLFLIFRLEKSESKLFLIRFFVIQFIGMMVYFMLYEIAGIKNIAKLQWFKTTIWIGAFCCLLIAMSLTKKILFQYKLPNQIFFIGALFALVLITNSQKLPFQKLRNRYKIGNYEKSDLTLLHEWIEKNTPKSAVFLTLPDDMSFSCEAKRAMPIATHAMVHEPFYMLEWYQKYNEIYGANLSNSKKSGFRKIALENYNTIYKKIKGIDYRIDDVSTCKYLDSLNPAVIQIGKFRLSKI
jgi:hypothetical protein